MSGLIFSSDWKTMIQHFQCDKCHCRFTGDEIIYTDHNNDYCNDCFNLDDNRFILMTSRERVQLYCQKACNTICRTFNFEYAQLDEPEVASGGINYE